MIANLIKLRAVQKLCINLIYHRVTVQVIFKSIEIVYDLVNSSYLVNVYDSGSEEIEFTLVYNYFGCFKKKVSRNISLNKESVAVPRFFYCYK